MALSQRDESAICKILEDNGLSLAPEELLGRKLKIDILSPREHDSASFHNDKNTGLLFQLWNTRMWTTVQSARFLYPTLQVFLGGPNEALLSLQPEGNGGVHLTMNFSGSWLDFRCKVEFV